MLLFDKQESLMVSRSKTPSLKFQPATASRWSDLEELFGERGACGGCWCMFWRLPRKEWDAKRGAGNKRASRKIVISGQTAPGVIAYVGKAPVGWCAIAPRAEYVALERSRILRPLDDLPVWSHLLSLRQERAPASGCFRSLAESGRRICGKAGRKDC